MAEIAGPGRREETMKVFCWDFHGTLTHPDALWRGCVFDILKALVPDCTDETCERVREGMWGKYPWDMPERDEAACRGEEWWKCMERCFYEGCVGCGISPALAQRAAELFRPTIKQPSRYTLYEDAIPTLREVHARGAKNVLLSNNYPDLDEVVERLGLLPEFDHMVISGKVGYNKPRREIFELAKRKYPGAEFYMIGDNPTADVLGGKQSGMKAILVHRGFCEGADFCFDDLKSVLSPEEIWKS